MLAWHTVFIKSIIIKRLVASKMYILTPELQPYSNWNISIFVTSSYDIWRHKSGRGLFFCIKFDIIKRFRGLEKVYLETKIAFLLQFKLLDTCDVMTSHHKMHDVIKNFSPHMGGENCFFYTLLHPNKGKCNKIPYIHHVRVYHDLSWLLASIFMISW